MPLVEAFIDGAAIGIDIAISTVPSANGVGEECRQGRNRRLCSSKYTVKSLSTNA